MYLLVFRNRKRADIDQAQYDAEAEHMEQLAAQQPGYLSFKSFTAEDGEVVSVSEWENEACALAWGKHADHLRAQWHGREAYYDEYTVLACDEPRIRRFKREDRA